MNNNKIDTFLKCLSVGKELNRHKKEYNKAVGENIDGHLDDYLEQKTIIIRELQKISEEECINVTE